MTDLFERWTPAERWLAGVLWADGHLVPGSRNVRHQIILNSVDDDLIAAAAEVIGPSHRRYPSQPPRKPTQRPLHRLHFIDDLEALARLGFGPKQERPWPSDLDSAELLRGFFDGDGCVIWHPGKETARWYLRVTLASPAVLLEGVRSWLTTRGMAPKAINKHGSSWAITWNHADSLRLADIMYAEPGPHLARKRERFRSQNAP